MSIELSRGTNISHWLSQSEQRGDPRRAFFTWEDVKRIADWGFDHIRLPVDEEQMWEAAGMQEAEAFDLMDAAVDWSERAGLNVVIDLHILRSHHFNQKNEPALFTDPAEAEKFADFWRQLSSRLKSRSTDRVAYELMNEAVAADADDWNRVAMIGFDAIRKLEPERTIILGSNRWNSAATFDRLHVPEDPRTILTFHFYHPMLVTHHRASWWSEGGTYDGPVQYPGKPIPDATWDSLPEAVQGQLRKFNLPYGRSAMVEDMAKPLAVARRTRLPLYCGEFGVIDLAPQPIRLAWYRDIISVFDEFGIGWASWDYKGGFGIIDRAGMATGIAKAMLESASKKRE